VCSRCLSSTEETRDGRCRILRSEIFESKRISVSTKESTGLIVGINDTGSEGFERAFCARVDLSVWMSVPQFELWKHCSFGLVEAEGHSLRRSVSEPLS